MKNGVTISILDEGDAVAQDDRPVPRARRVGGRTKVDAAIFRLAIAFAQREPTLRATQDLIMGIGDIDCGKISEDSSAIVDLDADRTVRRASTYE